MSDYPHCCLEITLGLLGAMIGVGQILVGDAALTMRRVVGRAIVAAGLSIAAGSILLLIPKAPVLAIVGLSAVFATLGTDGVERLLVRYCGLERRRKEG